MHARLKKKYMNKANACSRGCLRVRRGDRSKAGGVRHAMVAMHKKYVIRRFPPSSLCLGSPDPVLVKGIMEGAL
jgi:hypothetical protein